MDTLALPAVPPLLVALPPAPVPDSRVFECDPWHPADYQRPIFADYAAAPPICRVEWLPFDPNAPAHRALPGDATEDTWISVGEAYRRLPDPMAIETIILAHVGLAHRIVANIANRLHPVAMHLEPQGFASIAEDWFSMALLKMLQVVIGDRKRAKRGYGLRCIGEKHGWDDLAAPGHIAKYLGAAVKYEIWQSHKREQTTRKHTIAYLLVRHSGWQGSRISNRTRLARRADRLGQRPMRGVSRRNARSDRGRKGGA